jgi:hypothetical protein
MARLQRHPSIVLLLWMTLILANRWAGANSATFTSLGRRNRSSSWPSRRAGAQFAPSLRLCGQACGRCFSRASSKSREWSTRCNSWCYSACSRPCFACTIQLSGPAASARDRNTVPSEVRYVQVQRELSRLCATPNLHPFGRAGTPTFSGCTAISGIRPECISSSSMPPRVSFTKSFKLSLASPKNVQHRRARILAQASTAIFERRGYVAVHSVAGTRPQVLSREARDSSRHQAGEFAHRPQGPLSSHALPPSRGLSLQSRDMLS